MTQYNQPKSLTRFPWPQSNLAWSAFPFLGNNPEEWIEDFFNTPSSFSYYNRPSTNYSCWEDSSHVYLEVPTPGFTGKNLDITYENGYLNITGERNDPTESKKTTRIFSKTPYNFSYRIPVSGPVDTTKNPTVTCKNGILCCTFNKARASQLKHIPVKAG